MTSGLQGLRTEKLNQFLTACGKEEKVLGQPKKGWENLSKQRNVYVARATTAIVAALDVITPGDAGHLWTGVKLSRSVETALEIDESVDRKYLEALAETTCHRLGHQQAGPGYNGRLSSRLCLSSAAHLEVWTWCSYPFKEKSENEGQ